MADATYEILGQSSNRRTGQTLIDQDVLAAAGADLSRYPAVTGTTEFDIDLFL